MHTYSIKDFPAKSDEINAALGNGEEVAITRNGKVWFKLGPAPSPDADAKSPLSGIREKFARLPDLEYEDFQAVKTIWGPHDPCGNVNTLDRPE